MQDAQDYLYIEEDGEPLLDVPEHDGDDDSQSSSDGQRSPIAVGSEREPTRVRNTRNTNTVRFANVGPIQEKDIFHSPASSQPPKKRQRTTETQETRGPSTFQKQYSQRDLNVIVEDFLNESESEDYPSSDGSF